MKYTATIQSHKVPAKVIRDMTKSIGQDRMNLDFPEVLRYTYSNQPNPTERQLRFTIDPKAPSGTEIQFIHQDGTTIVTYNLNDGQMTAAQWKQLNHECRKHAQLLLEYKIKWIAGIVVGRPEHTVRVYLHVRSSKNCRATIIDDLESYSEIRNIPDRLVPTEEIRDNP